jgi:polysaccharide pyruvyl transferase WcaK-like protein
VHSLIQAIRKRVPDSEIVAISMYPPDTEARHHVQAWRIGSVPASDSSTARGLGPSHAQWKRKLREGRMARRIRHAWREVPASWSAFRRLRAIDRLIVAGSGPLEDDPGSAYRVLKWTTLARLAGAQVAFASVGAGPLDRRVNRLFVRWALSLADYVSVRDQSSADLIRKIGYKGRLTVRPDMAFGFPVDALLPSPTLPGQGCRTVGVNIMSINEPRRARGIDVGDDDVSVFQSYIARLVDVTARLLVLGYRVVLFSSEFNHDLVVRREFLERFASVHPGLASSRLLNSGLDDTASDLLPIIASCDYVVATRFHSALFALLMDKPVVGLVYHPKMRDLLTSFGLADSAFDVETFDVGQVENAIATLQSNRPAIVARLAATAALHRAEVESQFDALVAKTMR